MDLISQIKWLNIRMFAILVLWKKVYLTSILQLFGGHWTVFTLFYDKHDISLPTEVSLVKAMIFLVVK